MATMRGRSATAASSSRRATAARTGASCRPDAARLYAVHFIARVRRRRGRPGRRDRHLDERRRRRPGRPQPAARQRTCARSPSSARRSHGRGPAAARSCAATTPARPGCRAIRRRARRSTRSPFATASKAGPPARAASCCTRPTAERTGRSRSRHEPQPARAVVLRQRSAAGSSATRRPPCASAAARPTWPMSCCPQSTCRSSRAAATSTASCASSRRARRTAHQPDGGAGARLAPGAYLLYLDAWQRHVSQLEAPAIREVALGGPDTATRARTVAQVRALRLPASSPFDWNCDSTIPAWDALVARAQATARRTRRAAAGGRQPVRDRRDRGLPAPREPALPRRGARRRRDPDLQVVARERLGRLCGQRSSSTAQQQTTVTLAARGRDANLDLAVHDRVELLDDDAELGTAPAFFEYLATATTSSSSCWPAGRPTGIEAVAPSDPAPLGPQARRPARTCCRSSRARGSSSRTACRCASSPAAPTDRATTGRFRRARSPPTSNGRATTTAIRSRGRRPASPMPIAGSASSRWAATARSRGQRLPRPLPAAHRDGAAAVRVGRRPGRRSRPQLPQPLRCASLAAASRRGRAVRFEVIDGAGTSRGCRRWRASRGDDAERTASPSAAGFSIPTFGPRRVISVCWRVCSIRQAMRSPDNRSSSARREHSSLQYVSGDGQQAMPDNRCRSRSRFASPMGRHRSPGVPVHFAIISGGGSLVGAATVSDGWRMASRAFAGSSGPAGISESRPRS